MIKPNKLQKFSARQTPHKLKCCLCQRHNVSVTSVLDSKLGLTQSLRLCARHMNVREHKSVFDLQSFARQLHA